MDALALRRIEFAVGDTVPGAHVLEITGFDHRTVAHAVFMLELAFQDITENFRVLVTVRAKSLSRLNGIVVDHAQRAKSHMPWIVKAAERERMLAVQPAQFSFAAIVSFANLNHERASII